MEVRQRRKVIQTVKAFDAFPKTSEECLDKTSTGGTMSLVGYGVMLSLIVMEGMYYLETGFTFTFKPDVDFDERLKINVDITIAMPCRHVGADVLDMTGDQIMTFGELEMEETWFELDKYQREHFEGVQRVNSYLREQFHSVHDLLWRSGYTNIFGNMPSRRVIPERSKDGCRVHGSLGINKVAGNFHITAGKTLPLPRGHAHLAVFMEDTDYNFTHRIDKFSFGDPAPGIIHPLEGDELIAKTHFMTFQYFLTAVPTHVNTYSYRGNTYQYSVSQQEREISHDKGSHGTPGVFFKYDVSALKVHVTEAHQPVLEFLTRLCGILGGVFTCSGLVNRFVGFLVSCLTCRYFRKPTSEEETKVHPSASLLPHSTATITLPTGGLIPQPTAASTVLPEQDPSTPLLQST